jgi:hypothetical protein
MRGLMQERLSASPSWRDLLCAPPRAAHVLQLYDSDPFLARAVAHFAAEGLKSGEAVRLSGTAEHIAAIRAGLESLGLDVPSALRDGRLALDDMREQLSVLAPGGVLDAKRFEAAVNGALERVRGDARFTGARWWGEMASTLHQRGDRDAGLAAERVAGAAAKKQGATFFCSFLCDRYDVRAYEDVLCDLCCAHSHVVPAEDYVRHRLAVNRAIADVIGELRGSVLQSLASWRGLPCSLPSSQALLFWVRETMPERFAAVLERARAHHTRAGSDS